MPDQSKFGNILIVDDDEDVLMAARLLLKQHVRGVTTEKDPREIPNLITNFSYDVILLDMNFTRDLTGGQEGFHWLSKIFQSDPSAVVILARPVIDIINRVRIGNIDTGKRIRQYFIGHPGQVKTQVFLYPY